MACDAIIAPIVTGEVDPGVLDDLVRLCVELDRLDHAADRPGPTDSGRADSRPAASPSREALQKAIIGKAINFLLHSCVPLDLRIFHSTDRFIPVAIVREKD